MAGRVNEDNTSLYTSQLVDENQVNIPLSAINSMVLTLYDQVTGVILNGRNKQTCLNANGVAVSSTGAVSWVLAPADNAIVNQQADSELHIALFELVYSGNKEMKHEFPFRVKNINLVTS